MASQRIDCGFLAKDQTGLRSSQQFVAAARHQIGAGRQRLAQARFCCAWRLVQQPAAEIGDDQKIMLACKRGQLRDAGLRRESDRPEVALMHLEQHARVGADRRAIVLEPRLVRGADFDQAGAALSDHIGHTKAAADLDQFAPRDDHLAAACSARSTQAEWPPLRCSPQAPPPPPSIREAVVRAPAYAIRAEPVARSNSRLQYPAATSVTAAIASAASGARPRLVCRTMPVALIVRRRPRRRRAASFSPERARTVCASGATVSEPAPICSRNSSRVSRSALITAVRPNSAHSESAAGISSSRCTCGRSRRGLSTCCTDTLNR